MNKVLIFLYQLLGLVLVPLILTDSIEEKSLINIVKTLPRLSLFKRRKIVIDSSQDSFIYKLKRQTTIFVNQQQKQQNNKTTLILAGSRALVAIRSAISTANWVVVFITGTTRQLVLCCLHTSKKGREIRVIKQPLLLLRPFRDAEFTFRALSKGPTKNVIHKRISLFLFFFFFLRKNNLTNVTYNRDCVSI